MPRPSIESKEQRVAYELWLGLGYGRSLNETARRVGKSGQTVSVWAKKFGWQKRLEAHSVAVEKQKASGALMPIDDPIIRKIMTVLEQAEAAIDSVFVRDMVTGKLTSSITIVNADDLSKVIKEYRQMLDTYRKFILERDPAATKKVDGAGKPMNIKEFNVNMGDIPQKERINMLKGMLNGNESGGDSGSEEGFQDADYTEVSERGDEDG